MSLLSSAYRSLIRIATLSTARAAPRDNDSDNEGEGDQAMSLTGGVCVRVFTSVLLLDLFMINLSVKLKRNLNLSPHSDISLLIPLHNHHCLNHFTVNHTGLLPRKVFSGTAVCIRIEKIKLKDPAQYIEPFFTISFRGRNAI
jgi:hypothetical protein